MSEQYPQYKGPSAKDQPPTSTSAVILPGCCWPGVVCTLDALPIAFCHLIDKHARKMREFFSLPLRFKEVKDLSHAARGRALKVDCITRKESVVDDSGLFAARSTRTALPTTGK